MEIAYCIYLLSLFTVLLSGESRGRAHAIRNLAYYLNLKFTEKRYKFNKPE